MWIKTKHNYLVALLTLGAGTLWQSASAELKNATLSIDNLQRQALVHAPATA